MLVGKLETSGVVACRDKVVGGNQSVGHVRSHLVLFKLYQATFEEGEMWCRSVRISKLCPIP